MTTCESYIFSECKFLYYAICS